MIIAERSEAPTTATRSKMGTPSTNRAAQSLPLASLLLVTASFLATGENDDDDDPRALFCDEAAVIQNSFTFFFFFLAVFLCLSVCVFFLAGERLVLLCLLCILVS